MKLWFRDSEDLGNVYGNVYGNYNVLALKLFYIFRQCIWVTKVLPSSYSTVFYSVEDNSLERLTSETNLKKIVVWKLLEIWMWNRLVGLVNSLRKSLVSNVKWFSCHGVLQGISPTLKYWSHPFLPSPPPPPPPPPQKKNILNLSDPPSPFPHPLYEQPPQNFRELDSPLEIYPRPKKQRLIF